MLLNQFLTLLAIGGGHLKPPKGKLQLGPLNPMMLSLKNLTFPRNLWGLEMVKKGVSIVFLLSAVFSNFHISDEKWLLS